MNEYEQTTEQLNQIFKTLDNLNQLDEARVRGQELLGPAQGNLVAQVAVNAMTRAVSEPEAFQYSSLADVYTKAYVEACTAAWLLRDDVAEVALHLMTGGSRLNFEQAVLTASDIVGRTGQNL